MATRSGGSLSDRIADSYKQLAEAAVSLNSASDELAKTIGPVDAALKKLNLGVAAWHSYVHNQDQTTGDYWSRRIGYARVGRKWGLALSTVSGNVNYEDDDYEEWLFNDSPRWLRIEAVDHIPDLLELLVKEAGKVTTDLQKKTAHARELAQTISVVSGQVRG